MKWSQLPEPEPVVPVVPPLLLPLLLPIEPDPDIPLEQLRQPHKKIMSKIAKKTIAAIIK